MVWQWKNTRMVYFCLSLTPVFQKKKNQVFHSPRNEICQPRKEGKRKMLPHKLSKNSWRRSQKTIKKMTNKKSKEFIKYYWEKQNQAIWISHLTQQSFINSPTTLIFGRWVKFLEIELALKYGLSRINSL